MDLDQTLQFLGKTIEQQSAASINNISVPEFRGQPHEDVKDFLRRFKLATLTLPDNYRCLAITKSLRGAAAIWAKNNIKQDILEGDWKAIKRAMVARYSSIEDEISLRQQLHKMTFNENTSSLMSYVEVFAATYRRAFSEHSDKELIEAININLPNKVVRSLNLMNDAWTDFEHITDLYKLIKRYESRIQPYEDLADITNNNALTQEQMLNIFNDFRKSMDKIYNEDREALQQQVTALFTTIQEQHPHVSDQDKY